LAEQPEMPPPTIWDLIGRLITRQDALIEYIAKIEAIRKEIDLSLLKTNYQLAVAISTIAGISPPAPPPEIPPIEIPIEVPIPIPAPPVTVPLIREKNYVPKEDTVNSTSPAKLKIKEGILYKTSNWGYLYPVDGTIKVKINQGEQFTLDRGMIFEWHEYNLAVDEIEITTESATDVKYRLMAI